MSRVANFILRAHTGTGSRHSQYRNNSGEVWKNADEWTGRIGISTEKSLAVGIACMTICGPTQGLKGRSFELWVLNREVFDF